MPKPGLAPAATLPEVPKPVEGLKVHTIQKGDTLISVALANGLDYRELAAWNNIENPNVIKLGETLRLTAPGTPGSQTDIASAAPAAQPQPGAPVSAPLIITPVPNGAGTAVANSDKFKTEPKASKVPYTDAAYAKALGESSVAAPAVVAVAPGSAAPAVVPSLPPSVPSPSLAPPASGDDVDWSWPIQPVPKGKIVATFTDANKGVDISGSKGTAVLASAAGKVVYSGAGLRGYGRLVIIKHNATWLSAYAHNEKILVAEGAEVKKGQKIAEMGSSDADQVKLH
ncbi:MAG: peptidoglycan DD-metalloendopeptidase family protein, partial [Usitatibacteraceae bacterium]